MFTLDPEVYDALYLDSEKDYEREIRSVLAAVRAHTRHIRSVLDVACGTGIHLAHLPDIARRTGVDINPTLLASARARCPDATFIEGDMTDLAVEGRFDVVTCMFASISYAGTLSGLRRSVAGMARVLAPGGVLAIDGGFRPDDWCTDVIGSRVVDRPALKVVRMGRSTREGNIATVELEYLIGTPERIWREREVHRLGLFDWDDYRDAFARAGLDFHLVQPGPCGRGLLLGTTG